MTFQRGVWVSCREYLFHADYETQIIFNHVCLVSPITSNVFVCQRLNTTIVLGDFIRSSKDLVVLVALTQARGCDGVAFACLQVHTCL